MAAIAVRNLAGEVIDTLQVEALAGPEAAATTALAVKLRLQEMQRVPAALQRLVLGGRELDDDSVLELAAGTAELVLVRDETPLWTWDIQGNPGSDLLATGSDGHTVTFATGHYCKVLTKEPIRSGVHFFEFVMHKVGDEQWCGVTDDASMAGTSNGARTLRAWTYYCGRQNRPRGGSIRDGLAALHMNRQAIQQWLPVRDGTVIGMVLDADRFRVAFSNDGRVMGACAVPAAPLYLLTHLDDKQDKVELRKPPLADAPPGFLAALDGPLLSPPLSAM